MRTAQTAIGAECVQIAAESMYALLGRISTALKNMPIRESTRQWRRGKNDYVECLTLEVGDGAEYVMRMPWGEWRTYRVSGRQPDDNLDEYHDVRQAIRQLIMLQAERLVNEAIYAEPAPPPAEPTSEAV